MTTHKGGCHCGKVQFESMLERILPRLAAIAVFAI